MTGPTELELYRKTRDLLSDPLRHTTAAMARTESGDAVSSLHPAATCWCLLGALEFADTDHSRPYDGVEFAYPMLVALAALTVPNKMAIYTLLRFNDNQPHAAVIALLDEAISKLQPA